jgi:long-chain fatty acid transport protein
LALVAGNAGASGFFINQQSIPGLGRVDAGNVAAANDTGTIFFNPAGLPGLLEDGADDGGAENGILSSGLQLIIPRSDLDNAGSTAMSVGTGGLSAPVSGPNQSDPSDPTPVLPTYFAWKSPDRDAYFGIGITFPFGLSSKYDDDWFGRYDSIEAELTTVNIGPTMALRLNDTWSIGGGIDIQYADSTLSSALPNPFQPGGPSAATDGKFKAQGDDWSLGFNIGIAGQVSESTRVGAHFRSRMKHDISGTGTTSGFTGPLASLNGKVPAKSKLELPPIFAVGFATDSSNGRFTWYGDATWYGWSVLDTTEIRFPGTPIPSNVRTPNFDDSYTLAFGVDFHRSEKLTLRGGLKYDRSPTVDGFRDTTFADDDRFWIGLGATYRASPAWTIDFAFNHVFVDDSEIDLERNFYAGTPLPPTSARVRADVSSVVNTVSVGFRYRFGR